MFENNSKMPKFFVYMQAAIAVLIFVGMFFSSKLVASIYFIGVILSVLLLLLDKKYKKILTNYKLTFLLFDITNLIAIISILYYEFNNKSRLLYAFLVGLIVVEGIHVLVDIFVIDNKNLTKQANLFVDTFKIASMICILTYFFNVSELFFALDALIFEVAILVLKLYINSVPIEPVQEQKNTKKDEHDVEEIIHSTDDGEVE